MESSFGWVDFGEQERRQMLDMLDMFRETETRDELGLGTIRDAFSDYFFPGTSTIQTRPKYMLFVPWIYRKIEDDRVPSHKVAKRARNDELKLILTLCKAQNTDGVIGIEAKERLKSFPSSIYWSGLGSWGIRRFSGSKAEYHRSIDRYHKREIVQDDDREVVPGSYQDNWDPNLPPRPKNLLETAELTLNRGEAEYLRDRILNSHHSSLLAFMVVQDKLPKADFFWALPILRSLHEQLRAEVHHAQYFSETMHGAVLLYNLMLLEERAKEKWIDDYRDGLADWGNTIASRGKDINSWQRNMSGLWQGKALQDANITRSTSEFVEAWCALVA